MLNEFAHWYYKAVGNSAFKTRFSTWNGVPIIKYPTDLMVYQQIIVENKPDLIIETGTFMGGSALYMASICDMIDHGEVITVDLTARDRKTHPRVTYWTGRSTAWDTMAMMKERAAGKSVMVVLDSNHAASHVKRELVHYSHLVGIGQYLIVEDTFYTVAKEDPPGPRVAVDWFLAGGGGKNFVIEPKENLFFLTLNPQGYLKRIS